MTIEEFLGILPKWIQETSKDRAGIFMRFSASRNKWLVAYGFGRAKRYEKHQNQVGSGDTLEEALLDLVEKIKLYNFSDKYGKATIHKH